MELVKNTTIRFNVEHSYLFNLSALLRVVHRFIKHYSTSNNW
ncbi:protein of unknown function [Vibrio tapetis subsp. tapetis]|uniref:Uncharacterized protein n=1 Tax=Vibrio tapetis subsp. tapetis TaxID=1671868 RepID=A0A2N8ZG52_9VIBR|nr:protein of unknown function [Vibrio tapetis subsp. tapetis]